MLLISILSVLACLSPQGGVVDTPFIQEYHEAHPVDQGPGSNDVRAIAVDKTGAVWAATGAGVYRMDKPHEKWIGPLEKDQAGPTYDITVDQAGTVWVGAWNGLYRFTSAGLERLPEITHPIAALGAGEEGVWALGGGRICRVHDGRCYFLRPPFSRQFRAVLPVGNDNFWIGTGMGLYSYRTRVEDGPHQDESELVSPDIHDLAFDADGRLWIGSFGGVTVYDDETRVASFTPGEGLPSIAVQCVALGPDDVMWVGTDSGVARYDGDDWSLRHSRRWLVSDDVRDIAFDVKGTAWIATSAGVSAIKRRTMTLAQKADHYLDICLARHVREPGLVEKCRLRTPGDTSSWTPRDDDNDGQYTAMYLAMESFRYGATKDPGAKANAKRAFEALRFLQTVTETSGFVARTVIPISWKSMADPNRTISDRQWAEMVVDNPREKRIETRWRRSRDGKWRWKADTSSDEITGHMFGYLFYYDLVADEAERRHVAKHICNVVDYIIDSGYVLKGMDGTHTKWAVWAPEKLNHDPDWAPERGVNSVEILSFLKLAHHVSGDERYQRESRRLLREHGYVANVKRAKTVHPAWRTHIDDELLALAYPCLLMHEDDPELKRLYRESLDQWYAAVEDDCSPYFDYTYAACANTPPRREVPIAYLRDASLDLVRWTVDNSRREDLQIVRRPELEHRQTNRLLPPSESGVIRWDENPWRAIQGDGGRTESDGVWWLLPYWMGRYYDYIQPAR